MQVSSQFFLGYDDHCGKNKASINGSASIEEGRIQYSLHRLKKDKIDFEWEAELYKIPVLDDFVNAYVEGDGSIICRDRIDNSQFYNLTYDGMGGFVIGPVPREAKGSHYMRSSIKSDLPGDINLEMR